LRRTNPPSRESYRLCIRLMKQVKWRFTDALCTRGSIRNCNTDNSDELSIERAGIAIENAGYLSVIPLLRKANTVAW
jgi:hypothetical protein